MRTIWEILQKTKDRPSYMEWVQINMDRFNEERHLNISEYEKQKIEPPNQNKPHW